MPKLAVLASGTGSILQAIIDYPLPVELVITDRTCPAQDIALDAGIAVQVICRSFDRSFDRKAREEFSLSVAESLSEWGEEDTAAMAGFQTVLSPVFFSVYRGVLLNTHPSLLPAFRGKNAVARALESGEKETGCTVHEATAALDEGPMLGQRKVPIFPADTVGTLHERIKEAERELYPRIIASRLNL